MPRQQYDLLIVGAGAAGCAAAAHLPRGMSALLIDQREPENGRCCGGLIAADAQRALSRLGLEVSPAVRVEPEPTHVRVLDLESGRTQIYLRNYWNVNRARFDAWLFRLATRKAEFSARTRFIRAEPAASGFEVLLSSASAPRSIRCRFIIGADGARSRVRGCFFPDRPAPAAAIALQAALPPCPGLTCHEVLFSTRLTDFYAWAIPKDDCVLVGTAFRNPAQARTRFEHILDLMCGMHGISRTIVRRCSRFLSRPRHRAELFPGSGSVLLCGEAAGLVSPSSGEGISYAVESGHAAGLALAARSPGQEYVRLFRPIARRVTSKFLKAGVVFRPWARRLAMRIPYYP